jgi:signal transduction histidine kinase
LTTIDNLATKMTEQINELLDVAGLQAGQQLELNRQPTDLLALVRRVADECHQMNAHAKIQIDVMAPEIVGNWDQVRLARVLSNLIDNAIKYSPHDELVTLVLKQEERDGVAWAVLDVQDQGIGIPESDLDRIFERFYRASNAAGKSRGTGLGLASSRQIVQQHGGTITVRSEPGKGSTFTIHLPITTAWGTDMTARAHSSEHSTTP